MQTLLPAEEMAERAALPHDIETQQEIHDRGDPAAIFAQDGGDSRETDQFVADQAKET